MDDLDDIHKSEFVTDTDDQDSLDEKIDSEQRMRNHQLWLSFQNAACCITQLYHERSQTNIPPWVPFQNAASNLTSLYRDCLESQKRFAKIGYQIGRRKRMRDFNKSIKKRKLNPDINFQSPSERTSNDGTTTGTTATHLINNNNTTTIDNNTESMENSHTTNTHIQKIMFVNKME